MPGRRPRRLSRAHVVADQEIEIGRMRDLYARLP
jgi:hypothetical protein